MATEGSMIRNTLKEKQMDQTKNTNNIYHKTSRSPEIGHCRSCSQRKRWLMTKTAQWRQLHLLHWFSLLSRLHFLCSFSMVIRIFSIFCTASVSVRRGFSRKRNFINNVKLMAVCYSDSSGRPMGWLFLNWPGIFLGQVDTAVNLMNKVGAFV